MTGPTPPLPQVNTQQTRGILPMLYQCWANVFVIAEYSIYQLYFSNIWSYMYYACNF